MEKELIKKSHIIPDFLYRNSGMFDEKHRLRSISKQDLLKGKKPKLRQTGINDKNILCANCDNVVIGQYEKYASESFYNKTLNLNNLSDCKNLKEGNINFNICSNIDFKKYRLFLLSILFRASISKNSFFNEVKLSNANLENLRKMLFNDDPGNYKDFPFVLFSLNKLDLVSNDLIINPMRIEMDGMVEYNFVFAGILYKFYEGKNLDTTKFDILLMKPDNDQLTIIQMEEDTGKEQFNKLIGEN
ncbi:hypothetical protein [Aquimarina addita]|uniref:hypothetical protein n=1 Tax=Aquimarina addita TaxID=870485 RepID=UPI0031EDD53B